VFTTILVINPEPSEDERAAIVAALSVTSSDHAESAWWRSGITEALAGGDEDSAR
jgi:hypothetical protein